jgi:hypothetical protein
MKLKEIISIAGTSGLFKVIAQTKNGLIVENVADAKRQHIAATQQVSSLGEIAVFTKEAEMPLSDVLKKISEIDGGKISVDAKASPEELTKYFLKLIPDMDGERFHPSHMKKIITWYNLLNGKMDFAKQEEEEGDAKGILPTEGNEKQVAKTFETSAPKADKNSKVAPIKVRKKV